MCGEDEEVRCTENPAALEIELLERCYEELKKYESTLSHVLWASTMLERESHPLWWRREEVTRFLKELCIKIQELKAFQH